MRIVVFANGEHGECVTRAVRKFYRVLPVTHEAEPDVNSAKFRKDMADWKPDLFIVGGFPQIFREKLLQIPKFGTWNCHGGPLPAYRGGSPLNWQIIDGKSRLGVSLIVMDEGLDTGDVISTEYFRLKRDETIADAHRKANRLFPKMVLNALKNIDRLEPKPQTGLACYRRQRSDADGEISLSWEPDRIVNHVRALTHPYPGAWVRNGDRKIRIWSASVD